MTITTNNSGFTEASLDTALGAELHARYDNDVFYVVMERDHFVTRDGWYYNEESCREAAKFFLKLAEELDRRAAA